jgi:hypothetical protein
MFGTNRKLQRSWLQPLDLLQLKIPIIGKTEGCRRGLFLII